jgi:four helix bundle protein
VRDPRKLDVFHAADELVLDVYRATRDFPKAEHYGLRSQIRRAATSVPGNIVEGCAKRSVPDYLRFLNNALASASEVRYFLDLSRRLQLIDDAALDLVRRYDGLIRAIQSLSASIEARHEQFTRRRSARVPESPSP